MLRNQLQAGIPHLYASPTEGLNSSAHLFCLTKIDERKIVGKLQRLASMKLICRGRQKFLGFWDGMAQSHLMNVNKSAGRITGLHSSVSASFRFTRQSIHCIGQAGLLAWRVNRPGSKPVRTYILSKSWSSTSILPPLYQIPPRNGLIFGIGNWSGEPIQSGALGKITSLFYVQRVDHVGIQVSCSAEDHSAVRDGRSPVSKYSRTSLYIAGHLPHLKAIKQPSHHIHHTFQQIKQMRLLTVAKTHFFDGWPENKRILSITLMS